MFISGKTILKRLTVTVTNTLSNCTTDNEDTTAILGQSYEAEVIPNTDYTLTGATVSITMNGVDVTSSVYSNGAISIPSVTGNIVINISAVALQPVNPQATVFFEKLGGTGIPMYSYGNNDGMYGLAVDLVAGDSFHIYEVATNTFYGMDNYSESPETGAIFTGSSTTGSGNEVYIECVVPGTYTIVFSDGTLSGGTKSITAWGGSASPVGAGPFLVGTMNQYALLEEYKLSTNVYEQYYGLMQQSFNHGDAFKVYYDGNFYGWSDLDKQGSGVTSFQEGDPNYFNRNNMILYNQYNPNPEGTTYNIVLGLVDKDLHIDMGY